MNIYRAISDWTLDQFYSEVYIDGRDNIPCDGPVIMYAGYTFDVAFVTNFLQALQLIITR